MANSGNPSKYRVTIRSCYSIHEASQKLNHLRSTLSSTTFTGEIFRRPPFRPTSTPIGAPPSDLPSGGRSPKKSLTRAETCRSPVHAPARGGACNIVFLLAYSSRCVCHRQAHPSTPPALLSSKKPIFFSFSLRPLSLRFLFA